MDGKKIIKKTGGTALYGLGVAAELAKYGLHVSSVVMNGAQNMADHFAGASDIKIGETLLNDTQKGVGKLANWLMQKGKGLLR